MPCEPHTPTSAVHAAALERITSPDPRAEAVVIAAAALRPVPDHRRRLSADAILDHAVIDERSERIARRDAVVQQAWAEHVGHDTEEGTRAH